MSAKCQMPWVLETQGSCQRYPDIRSGLELSMKQTLTCDLSPTQESPGPLSPLLPCPQAPLPEVISDDFSNVTLEASGGLRVFRALRSSSLPLRQCSDSAGQAWAAVRRSTFVQLLSSLQPQGLRGRGPPLPLNPPQVIVQMPGR